MTLDDIARAYVLAWATTDASERRALLERCWADGGVYCDPLSRIEGRQALSDHIAGFQQSQPGFRIPLASGVDAHHNYLRFRWVMLDPNRNVVLEGFDVGELASDGRLQRITGFFGPFPKVPEDWPGVEVWRGS
jgi:hypothetical protein